MKLNLWKMVRVSILKPLAVLLQDFLFQVRNSLPRKVGWNTTRGGPRLTFHVRSHQRTQRIQWESGWACNAEARIFTMRHAKLYYLITWNALFISTTSSKSGLYEIWAPRWNGRGATKDTDVLGSILSLNLIPVTQSVIQYVRFYRHLRAYIHTTHACAGSSKRLLITMSPMLFL